MKKLFKVCLIVVLFFNFITVKSQKSHTEILGYNVIFNGLGASISNVFNNFLFEKDYSFKEIRNSFGKGCLGGVLIFSSKSLLSDFKNDKANLLTSKILFTIGNSIQINASMGKPMLEDIYIDYLFVHAKVNTKTFKVAARLDIFAFSSFVYCFERYSSVLFAETLMSGNLVVENNSVEGDYEQIFSSVALNKDRYNKDANILAKAMIRSFQSRNTLFTVHDRFDKSSVFTALLPMYNMVGSWTSEENSLIK